MSKLDSKRDSLGEFAIAIVTGFVLALVFSGSYNFAIALPVFLAIALIPWGLYWSLVGRKPAAWVEGTTLCVKSWPFTITRIDKDKLESIRYESGHRRLVGGGNATDYHKLFVKLKGFEEWEIPIIDKADHMNDLRLFKFINDHFVETKLIKKS